MNRCIPCEAKKALQKAKLSFLIQTAEARAVKANEDYAIYLDEDDSLKLATFSEAVNRGESIVQIILRPTDIDA